MYNKDIHIAKNVYLKYTHEKDWIFILSDPFHIIKNEERFET